ncbi:N-acetyltransferase family protein [Roseateles sp.]|uniref:GNAT family N-acetyltransferase n=1 Tax=Roseateles sp. TaxID=1971397 RepID=UPI003D12FAD1
MRDTPLQFKSGPLACRELIAADIPAVQRFLDANPEYFWTVGDEAPRPDEAQQEFDELPPPELSYRRVRHFGIDAEGEAAMVGYGSLLEDMVAEGVCHLGLFIIATARHGQGDAARAYQGLEDWARRAGARWMRLGVVVGNQRGERFWERQGFVELRRREGVPAGRRINSLRVLLKPLAAGQERDSEIQDYLARVARDRPEP